MFLTSLSANDIRALLFHGNCSTCHHKKESKHAPSIVEVKNSYKKAFMKRADFISYMSKWVVKPNRETSIMLQAIDKHGLMPELGYEKSVIEEISSYIYDNNFTLK